MREIFFRDIKKEKIEKIDSLRDGCWINIENASFEDIEYIARITNLQVVDIDDALDLYELPRIEREKDNVIIFIRDTQEQDKEDIYTTPLTVIISKKYIITISPSNSKTIRSIIEGNLSFSTTQKSKFLIHLLLLISRNFSKGIKKIKNNVLNQKKN